MKCLKSTSGPSGFVLAFGDFGDFGGELGVFFLGEKPGFVAGMALLSV